MVIRKLIPILAILTTSSALAQEAPRTEHVPDSIMGNVLFNARAAANKCYLAHVPADARGQGDNGRITIRIGYEGNVISAWWEDNTVQHEAARTCLIEMMRKLEFPAKTKSVTTVTVWVGLSSDLSSTVVRPMDPPAKKITSKEIVAAANKEMARFMACYTDRLSANPNLQGGVKIQVIVGRTGAVDKVEVLSDTMGDPAVSGCIVGIARQLRFDAPGDDAPIIARIPFKFQSR